MGYIIVFITAGSAREAEDIARLIVKKKLAACANIIAGVKSVYTWKGKLEESRESLIIAKTKAGLFRRLEKAVKTAHSYECPEIVAFPVRYASSDYLKWIGEVTA